MVEDILIKKVCERKDGIKYLLIPKNCSFLLKGEYAVITKYREGNN